MLRKTIHTVADIMAGGIGGVILAIVQEEILGKELQVSVLDNNVLLECFSEAGYNVHEQREGFSTLLDSFTAHNASDRWEQMELERLVERLPSLAEFGPDLLGNAKDGGLILSHKGNVKGAGVHLHHTAKRWQLRRQSQNEKTGNGEAENTKSKGSEAKAVGTRHASALAFAEWLGDQNTESAVFVRSDGGGAHLLLPQGRQHEPTVFFFETKGHPDQEAMLSMFRQKILDEGKLMVKAELGLARPGIRGERIITVVGDRVTSDVKIEDDDRMVIRASTLDQDLYVIPRRTFERNWQLPGTELDPALLGGDSLQDALLKSEVRQLIAKGYKLYQPNPNSQKMIYTLTAVDKDNHLPTGVFTSSWGALQPVQEGDSLAMPHPDHKEIYLMPPEVVACYEPVSNENRRARTPLENNRRHLSQREMLVSFESRVRKEGIVMRKTTPALARKADINEVIAITKGRRVVGHKNIDRDDLMVVRSPDHSVDTMEQQYFHELHEEQGSKIEGRDPVQVLLAKQGFKEYYQKFDIRSWIYKLRESDLNDVPSGYFESPCGALTHVQAGDTLCMPIPLDGGAVTQICKLPTPEGYEEIEQPLPTAG